MSRKDKPILIIFAGANGSGKTTAAKALLPKEKILEFVNADEIARGLSPFNPSGQAVTAGKLVLQRIKNLIETRQSFAIETTLSGQTLLKYLKRARTAGYQIEMNFLFTTDIDTNIKRIRNRVIQGGHHVPSKDVKRRYHRGLVNFIPYTQFCDTVDVYDTTQGDPLLFLRSAENRNVYKVYDLNLAKQFQQGIADAS